MSKKRRWCRLMEEDEERREKVKGEGSKSWKRRGISDLGDVTCREGDEGKERRRGKIEEGERKGERRDNAEKKSEIGKTDKSRPIERLPLSYVHSCHPTEVFDEADFRIFNGQENCENIFKTLARNVFNPLP
jgi:hypothetical protein